MRTFLLTLILSAAADAQSATRAPNRIGVESTLRASPPLLTKFTRLPPRTKSLANGPLFFSRVLLDKNSRAYFGYELLVEQQQPGTYLATFGKLGATTLDLASEGYIKFAEDWLQLPLPEIPKTTVVHDNEIVSIAIYQDPSTGEKLIDDIRILPPLTQTRFIPVPTAVPMAPTVTGPARDFSPADADLLLIPRAVTLNGIRQADIPIRNVQGPLVWLYLPNHGRYIFSLTPRPGLDFQRVGEARGGVIAFTIGTDSIVLESNRPIATGDSAYHLYVLHDQSWQPTTDVQKTRPAIGTVSPRELTALQ